MKHKTFTYAFVCIAAAGLMLPAFAVDKINYRAQYDQLNKEYNAAFQDKD